MLKKCHIAQETCSTKPCTNRPMMVRASLALSILTAVASSPASASQVSEQPLPELIRDSGAVVVGKVVRSHARYGDASHRFIVTDYTVQIEDVLDSSRTIQPHSMRTVTYWGGTLDNQTQQIAGLSYPKAEGRYVFLLRPPESSQVVGVPVVGGGQGLLSVKQDPQSGSLRLYRTEGEPVQMTALSGEGAQASLSSNAEPLTLTGFMQHVRAHIQEYHQLPRSVQSGPQSAHRVPLTFRQDTLESPSLSRRVPVLEPLHREAKHPEEPGLMASSVTQHVSGSPRLLATRAPESGALGIEFFKPFGVAKAPIVVSQLPPGSLAPEDQYAMSFWNTYTANLFKVYATPPTTWAWNNRVFEIAGFVNDTTMTAQFGTTWAALGAIAVTFLRKDGSGVITEADIAINPSVSWTLDDESLYNGSSSQALRQSLTHELGHMLGLDHQFDYLAIMNYAPNRFRGNVLPYMDDVAGARALYPSLAVDSTDLGVYLFRSIGTQNWQEATIPSSVRIGSRLTVNDYHVENVGTRSVAAPRIEWYLTTQRNFRSTYHYLGASTYSRLDPFHFFTPSAMSVSFTIPSAVPPGNYYLAAFIRDDGGARTAAFQTDNNRAFSHRLISVTR